MQQLLIVGLGGACGAVARYSLTGFVHRKFPEYLPYPIGTLAVNVLGCFLIGILMTLIAERDLFSETVSENTRLLLITGFLGSLTTFSTFGYETVELMMLSNIRLACWNVAANVIVGCGAVFAGHWLTKSLL